MSRLREIADPFLLLLIAMVALASFLPARGEGAHIVGSLADAGIVLLFFLHGAKLSREAIWGILADRNKFVESKLMAGG